MLFDLCGCFFQPDSPEYKAACKLWELYLRTKNEFVQKGDAEEEDEDEEGHDSQELVSAGLTAAAGGSCCSVWQLTELKLGLHVWKGIKSFHCSVMPLQVFPCRFCFCF